MTPDLETKLKNLEARHAAHQAMLEEHREARHQRREKHKRRWHKMKITPIQLI
jgi:hypothetical protein